QTVAGLTAVFRAVADFRLDPAAFSDWAVLAAPRFLGRCTLSQALNRFALEGAWGISPHLIPHHSLHSTSGTISQALAIHGPNYGVGGGPDAAGKALLTAAALLAGDRLPGVWVVLTGYDPEPVPNRAAAGPPAAAAPAAVCHAVALALAAEDAGGAGLELLVSAVRAPRGLPRFRVEALQAALAHPDPAAVWRLGCGGRAELRRATRRAEGRP